MHTAQHLVNNCFASELVRGRTVILVTHHIGICLPISSYLVELSHGGVIRKGRIQEIEEKVLQNVIETEDKPFTTEDHDDLPVPEQVNEADVLHDSRKLHRKHPLKSKDGKLVEAEARAEGRVSLKTYLTYIRAAGIMSWVFTLLLMLAIRAINIGNQVTVYLSLCMSLTKIQVFLAAWGEAYQEKHPALDVRVKYPWDSFPSPDDNVKPWLMVYFYISMAGAFCVLFYIALGYYASLQASRKLFMKLLNSLIRASSRWLDTTPIG